MYYVQGYPPGMEISSRPLAHVSVKMSWASAICRFFAAFLKVTCQVVSAVKIKFPTLAPLPLPHPAPL